MMFEMPSDNHLDHLLNDSTSSSGDERTSGIQKLQEELDVCISIKPKGRGQGGASAGGPYGMGKSVLIKAQEKNASSMYKARQILLGLEGPPIEANIPETYKMPNPQGADSFYSLNSSNGSNGKQIV